MQAVVAVGCFAESKHLGKRIERKREKKEMGCGASQPQAGVHEAKPDDVEVAAPVEEAQPAVLAYEMACPAPQKEKSLAERKAIIDDIRAQLPSDRTEQSSDKRKKLFALFDANNNGVLSLPEIDAACRSHLHLDQFTNNLPRVLIRSYYAVTPKPESGVHDHKGAVDFDRFHKLLEYVALYFDVMMLFEDMDTTGDNRVSRDEFNEAVGKLRQAGYTITSPDECFEEIDVTKDGFIMFDEFCNFAVKKQMSARDADS